MTTNTTYRNMKQERDLALAECERLRTRHWTILDDMNKSELDAYDLGCAESIAAVDKILDGKDDGSGTNNEPWYTQRKRLLSLTAECERLKALINKALDDIEAEAKAFESLENAQANFSSSRPEARAYGIAMVKASKSSKALRDAARGKP